MLKDKQDLVYTQLITRILKRHATAWDDLFSMLPDICENISDDQLIGLIAFITGVFNYGNGAILKNLICHCKYLINRNITKKIFFSFFALLDNILAYSGSNVVDDLVSLAEFFHEKIPLDQREVATSMLCDMLDGGHKEDSMAVILRFVARMAPILTPNDIEVLDPVIRQFRPSSIVFLRLSAIEALNDIIAKYDDPGPIFYDVLIRPILTDKSDAVKCNSLRIISKMPQLCEPHIDYILKLACYKSWKIKLALTQTSMDLIAIPKMHDHFISQCKSRDLFVREHALHLMSDAIRNDTIGIEEAKPLVTMSLRNKHPEIISAGLRILDEVLRKEPAFLGDLSEFLELGASLDTATLKLFLNVIFTRAETAPEGPATRFIESSLSSSQWQDVLDAFTILLVCHDNRTHAALISAMIPRIDTLTQDPRAAIRDAAIASTARLTSV